MEQARKAEVSLAHPVEVTELLRYLVKELGCDKWYVACHYQNLFVFRLTLGARDRYAVSVECHGLLEQPVYEGSEARAVSISPLHGETNISQERLRALALSLGAAG